MIETERPVALITGASMGIGAELARAFAAGGHALVLVARSRERLEALAAELGGARVIVADLSQHGAAARLFAEAGPVDVLVNNAGFGAIGPFATLELERQMEMIDLNLRTSTELARLYLPGMLARGRGRILNVGSTSAFQPLPGLAVYAATKAFVLALSEALQEELAGTGVTVTCLCPGPTESGFAETAGMTGLFVFRAAMDAKEVARQGYAATMAGRRRVVPGWRNRAGALGSLLTPRGVLLRLVRRMLLGRRPGLSGSARR